MKRTIRLTESDLHRLIHESVRRVLNESKNETHIIHDGIDLLLSMNWEDMYIEYTTDDDRAILAGYYANEKMWVVQENLKHENVADGEDDIIIIAKTKSMPDALDELCKYIRREKHSYMNNRTNY